MSAKNKGGGKPKVKEDNDPSGDQISLPNKDQEYYGSCSDTSLHIRYTHNEQRKILIS